MHTEYLKSLLLKIAPNLVPADLVASVAPDEADAVLEWRPSLSAVDDVYAIANTPNGRVDLSVGYMCVGATNQMFVVNITAHATHEDIVVDGIRSGSRMARRSFSVILTTPAAREVAQTVDTISDNLDLAFAELSAKIAAEK